MTMNDFMTTGDNNMSTAEKNVMAMWTFITRNGGNGNEGKGKMGNNGNGNSNGNGNNTNDTYNNDDYNDDDTACSRISMSSIDKKQMAVPPLGMTVENSLSKELMKLSLNDRTEMEEEIHGVRCLAFTGETPELLVRSLREFDKQLMAVKNSAKRKRQRAKINRIRNGGRTVDDDVLRNVVSVSDDDDNDDNANDNDDDDNANDDANDNDDHDKITISNNPYNNIIPSASTSTSHSSHSSTTIRHNSTTASASASASSAFATANSAAEKKKKSCYVNDPDVRLRFLRCDRFDAKKAVKRFVKFLEFSQELYGSFVGDRSIRLSDLNTRQEKRALANIHFQFLPFRDRSGRRVFVGVGTCGYDIDVKLRCKILWYMFWATSEDVETQQKGVVIVGWPSDNISNSNNSHNNSHNNSNNGHNSCSDESSISSDNNNNNNFGDVQGAWEKKLRPGIANLEGVYQVKAMDGLPIRIASLHFCMQKKPVYKILSSLFYFALDSNLKSRYKVHFGESLEIRYNLQGYGIPVDLLPLTHTMTLKRQSHMQWIAFRKYSEQQQDLLLEQKAAAALQQENNGNNNNNNTNNNKESSISSLLFDPTDFVECPRSFDVIIGKAKYTNNPGNVFYRSLIEATHDEHISLSKKDKVEMTWRIVRQMEELDGRFLELNKSLKVWTHIKDRNVMRQKVAQSYKEYKRNAHVIRNKKHQLQEQASSTKRQKTALLTTIQESACFSGCNDLEDDNDTSFFTSM